MLVRLDCCVVVAGDFVEDEVVVLVRLDGCVVVVVVFSRSVLVVRFWAPRVAVPSMKAVAKIVTAVRIL